MALPVGVATSTRAPFLRSSSRGVVSSSCSTPSVQMMRIRASWIFGMEALLGFPPLANEVRAEIVPLARYGTGTEASLGTCLRVRSRSRQEDDGRQVGSDRGAAPRGCGLPRLPSL